ncbi:MAG TPA: cardiolipin synthase, partial [Chthoniobacteraceae bacterium]
MQWAILIFGYVLSCAAIPHLLLSKKRPASTLAWFWAILLFPYLGSIAYALLGADRMSRRRLRRIAKMNFLKHGESLSSAQKLSEETPAARGLLRAMANINQIPPSTATSLRLLIGAAEFYPALKQRIAEARHHIHIEIFIWRADEYGREFLDALVAAARRGVEVRLLLDQLGCFGVGRGFFQPLIDAGGQFSWFYSYRFWKHSRFINLRNHRKLQIIDGVHAFVGGMNIGREYAGKDPDLGIWRDTQIEACGNVVTFLQETFATDWFFATEEKLVSDDYYPEATAGAGHPCQVIAGGPDSPREPVPKSLLALLNFATERLWIATGYFAPDVLLLSALQVCAARGVDVRVLVSEKSDHPYLVQIGRSYYEDLLRFGVRVFEYSKGVNHSKAMMIDSEWMMIGSANSDNRSMRLNFELNL